MNEDAYAKQWVAVLDRSLVDLRPETVSKLVALRERACERAALHTGAQRNGSSHALTLVSWVRQHRVGAVGMLLAMPPDKIILRNLFECLVFQPQAAVYTLAQLSEQPLLTLADQLASRQHPA